MKIILMLASSVNGKITQGDSPDILRWTSKEDKELFATTKDSCALIVMGRLTYEKNLHHIKTSAKTLRIVLTKNPSAFADNAIAGQIEFSNESPVELVMRLESLGYTQMLLLGGAEISSAFLRDHLVDELHLTIEPRLFGHGKNMLANTEILVDMELLSTKRLNKEGTLFCTYTIKK